MEISSVQPECDSEYRTIRHKGPSVTNAQFPLRGYLSLCILLFQPELQN